MPARDKKIPLLRFRPQKNEFLSKKIVELCQQTFLLCTRQPHLKKQNLFQKNILNRCYVSKTSHRTYQNHRHI